MNKKAIKYFNGDELAASTWQNKYAGPDEETQDDTHNRMAKEFARVNSKYHRSEMDNKALLSELGKKSHQMTQEDIYQLFKNNKYVIPQGSIQSQLGLNLTGSLSNCFVVESPTDSYGGIFRADQHLGQIFKRRGGVGVDISELRPSGAKTANVAKTSTGAVSFMERYSNTTREVAQGGRRGALMISLDVRHPDASDFATIKQDLKKVTGANISIRLNEDFMRAMRSKNNYMQVWPCNTDLTGFDRHSVPYDVNTEVEVNGEKCIVRKVVADELWNTIIKAAHGNGEPGILFWDNVLEGPDGVYPEFIPISTNPCGEIPIPAHDSCRLMALNMTSFVDDPFDEEPSFNMHRWKQVVYQALKLNDDLVDLEVEHVDRIISKIENDPESDEIKSVELNLWIKIREIGMAGRRTGLGITGLGDTLAMLGLDYDSQEAMVFVDRVFKAKMSAELDATTDMAITRGAFPNWDEGKEYYLNHDGDKCLWTGENSFYQMLLEEFPDKVAKMLMYGRRNVSWSTVAPTGTISMLAQVTSGIEPLFQAWYTRRRKITDENEKADFVDANGDRWSEHPVLHHKFKEWIDFYEGIVDLDDYSKKDLNKLFEASPWYKQTANDIDYKARVRMQGIIQKWTTHSISSTVNLPNDIDVDTVKNIYDDAHFEGLKGITVYRDGCRDGVLVTEETKKTGKFEYSNAKVARPECVDAVSKVIQVSGDKYSVFVGSIDGKPYEVFAHEGTTKEGKGCIFKQGSGEYMFNLEGGIKDRILTGKMTPEQEMITRLVSGSLRHGRDIIYIVKDLEKTAGHMFSFNAALAKALKPFIPDGTKAALRCINPECTGDGSNVIYEEGCSKCLDCGASACS